MKKKLVCCLILGCCLVGSQVFALPIVGSSSGIFDNPTPAGKTVTGVGTSYFTWGEGAPDASSLQFVGTSFSTSTETPFSFGELTYYNGSTYSGTEPDAVDLATTLNLTTPAGVETFTYNFQLVNTLNTNDPNASADYVYFPSSYPIETFTAGGTDYTLELLGFGNPTSGGFTSLSEFHVLEGQTASVDLIGEVTATTHNVPEPSVLTLLIPSLLGLFFIRRKK